MANDFFMSIELTKYKGASVQDLKFNGQPVKCVIIPIEGNAITVMESGRAFANISVKDKNTVDKYGNSHYLRPYYTKEGFKSLSEEDRKNIPFLGNLKPSNYNSAPQNTQTNSAPVGNNNNYSQGGDSALDDIPF